MAWPGPGRAAPVLWVLSYWSFPGSECALASALLLMPVRSPRFPVPLRRPSPLWNLACAPEARRGLDCFHSISGCLSGITAPRVASGSSLRSYLQGLPRAGPHTSQSGVWARRPWWRGSRHFVLRGQQGKLGYEEKPPLKEGTLQWGAQGWSLGALCRQHRQKGTVSSGLSI